jgi:copper chaperone CopZ
MSLASFVADVRAALTADPVRLVYRAHGCPGRVRFRLTWLGDFRDEAERIAEALSRLDGVVEVRVRAVTGSVLVLYDPDFIDEARVTSALLSVTGVDHVSVAGHESPADRDLMLHDADERGSAISRQLVAAVEALHTDFLRFTHGRVSMASASALTMLALAIGRFAASEDFELPTWHQLAWYAYQTFKDVQDRYSAGHQVHRNSGSPGAERASTTPSDAG